MLRRLIAAVAVLCAVAVVPAPAAAGSSNGFVTRIGSDLKLNGKLFKFYGSNNYYLPYKSRLMVDDVFADAQAAGFTVLRTWGWLDQPTEGVYFQSFDAAAGHPVYNDGPDGLERMDYILRIVNCDDLVFLDAGHFLEAHPAKNPIQAVGFAGRARVRHHDLVDARANSAKLINTSDRLRIVRINTDEDVVFLIEDDAGGVFGHLVDHAAFLPGGHHQRNPLFGRQLQFLERNMGLLPISKASARDRDPGHPGSATGSI